jgi:glycosyltransferase involved in cell wall biosynthesis
VRIGFYSPFFGSTYGGGEIYLALAAAAVRDAFPRHEVEILSPAPADVPRYEAMLGLDLSGISFLSTNPAGGAGHGRRLTRMPLLRRARDLAVSAQAAPYTARYDLLFHQVYVLPAFSRARRSVILCQFPYPPASGRGPRARALAALRRRLFRGEFADFDRVVVQSEYVAGWVARRWRREATVVYPPVEVPEAPPDLGRKERVIVSVGRFFAGGHSKRHDVLVEAFRALVDGGLVGWELHLAGALHDDADDRAYFERVAGLARGYPVHIHTDAPRALVEDLYRRAAIYWHASGFGVDPERHPAEVEHFGITIAEAMGRGAVPVVLDAGGMPEVVEDGVSGYLWSDLEQLRSRTRDLAADAGLRRRLAEAGWERSRRFSRPEFARRIVDVARPLIEELVAIG